MERTAIYAACFLACALQFALGIGVTLFTRKRFPRAAYFSGFLAPLLIPIALWFLYSRVVSSQPCAPENRLSCGEGDAYAFLFLSGVLLFNVGVSAVIQFVLWQITRRKNVKPI